MERLMFPQFAPALQRLGTLGVGTSEFIVGRSGAFELQYIPFEHVNSDARLVIVGITPGQNQLSLSYGTAQRLLNDGRSQDEILSECKKAAAFGGPSMRPNLVKMLKHFGFDEILRIPDVETLWSTNAHLLHSTSVVPHAAFKSGRMFAGSFSEVMASPLLKECFMDCFVPSVGEIHSEAMFVGLGPCPQDALDWCVLNGHLAKEKVLGSFCHPSGSGGSTTTYFLRGVALQDLHPGDPVRGRVAWLDAAYERIKKSTDRLRPQMPNGEVTRKSGPLVQAEKPTSEAPRKSTPPQASSQVVAEDLKDRQNTDLTAVLDEFSKAGYEISNETKKVVEFRSPSDQYVYLIKTTSSLNDIYVMTDPNLRREMLTGVDGVAEVSQTHRFHSNMAKFPKKLNKGETPTAYGWQLHFDSLPSLERFLRAFKS
jgi:hypothetical protein